MLLEMWDTISIAYWMFCLDFCTAAAAEAKDLDQRLRQVKSIRDLWGQAFEIDEVTVDVLHRLTTRTHQVMMRFEIAVSTRNVDECGAKSAYHDNLRKHVPRLGLKSSLGMQQDGGDRRDKVNSEVKSEKRKRVSHHG